MSIPGRPRPAVTRHVDQDVVIGERVARRLPALLDRHGCRSVAVLASPRAAGSPLGRDLAAALDDGGVATTWWTDVPTHTSLASVEAAARAVAPVDGLVALGGGSASDLAKGVAAAMAVPDVRAHFIRRRPDGTVDDLPLPGDVPPMVAVPTTFSAAEVTWGAGITEDGIKNVIWDPALAPKVLAYETSALQEISRSVAVGTGMNAVAHCVEARYSTVGGPLSDALAEAGLAQLVEGLLRLVARGEETPDARALAFAGVVLSGQALANARIGLHHALVHVLGARTGAHHGDLNAVLLAAVADRNRPWSAVAQDRCAAVARASAARAGHDLGPGPLGDVLRALGTALGTPTDLPSVGATDLDVDAIWAALSLERGLAFNPAPVDRPDLVAVLTTAGADLPDPSSLQVSP